ncbi:MAG: acetylornithine deacetylase [Thermomicrobiales bacterium]|jgi:acetylornithine deacetylase/succinyl-diaminopimelate desuccinylase-like protein|nr:acetylornithine deacetylase [Thermomicrobiales bacterium]
MGEGVYPTVDRGVVVNLAREICRIPSPIGDEGPLARFIAGELERMGFDAELQDVIPGRPNVVAIKRGDPDYQSFVFNGHLDVVRPFGQWRHDPLDPWIEDDILYGAGIFDMKGGLAALIAGAGAAANAGLDRHGDIVVTAAMHHDTSGVGMKYFLESCSWRLDAGVCGEPTDLQVQLFHGGAWIWEITTTGLAQHQSRLEDGVDAIAGMRRILDRFDVSALTYTPDARYPYLPRVVTGLIQGGEFASVTAETCLARGDVRFLPSMTVDGLKADVRRIIDEVCAETPGLSGRVRTYVQQWPYEIAADEPVVRRLVDAHTRRTGMAPTLTTGLPAGSYISDAADMIRHGIPTVLYGPGNWRITADEGIPIRDLVTAADVYAATCVDTVTTPRQ